LLGPLDAAFDVIEILDQIEIDYVLGGSLASSTFGELARRTTSTSLLSSGNPARSANTDLADQVPRNRTDAHPGCAHDSSLGELSAQLDTRLLHSFFDADTCNDQLEYRLDYGIPKVATSEVGDAPTMRTSVIRLPLIFAGMATGRVTRPPNLS
jgi:hypothetical protein